MFKQTQDKPQGSEVVKQKKRGIHHCFYNCGRIFNDEEKAKNHVPCSGRDYLEATLTQMRALGTKKKEEEKSTINSVDVNPMENNEEETLMNVIDSPSNPASTSDEQEEMYPDAALPSEPIEDPMARVQNYWQRQISPTSGSKSSQKNVKIMNNSHSLMQN